MMRLFSFLELPEVSSYSDADYERLVGQAKLRRGDAIWLIPALAGALIAGAWIGAGMTALAILRASGSSPGLLALRGLGVANVMVGILLAVAAAVAFRWVLLVRSIKRLVNKAGCPFCEFSLVGLRVEHGWVRCPECGQRVYLHEHRLKEEDILTEEEKRRPIPGLGAGPMGAYKQRPKRS